MYNLAVTIVAIAILAFPICVLCIIVQAIRKKPTKIFKRAALICVLAFVAAIVLAAIAGGDPDSESGDATASGDVVESGDSADDTEVEQDTSDETDTAVDTTEPEVETDTEAETDPAEDAASELVEMLVGIEYTEDEAEAIAEILINVGILGADDMWIIMDNDPLKSCALEYNDHQVNFTTEDNILFYVQITGWDEEISHYGWYRSNWSGKLKYGYYTETEKYSVDLYSVDSDGSGGYYAVYNADEDSVSPYEE